MLVALALTLAPLPSQGLVADLDQTPLLPAPFAGEVVVTSLSRTVYGQAIGFDWEYDDGASDQDETTATSGAWTGVADADLVDYWDVPVGRGLAAQTTSVDAGGFLFDLASDATARGNHFQADALAEAECAATLEVPARVRVLVIAATDASGGYDAAELELREVGGPALVRAATSPWVSAPSDVQFVGWLAPGSYEFTCSTSAMAYTSGAQPEDVRFADVQGALRWFHAADFQLDGDVDRSDLLSFRNAWYASDSSADFDGDGQVTYADLVGFVTRYRRG